MQSQQMDHAGTDPGGQVNIASGLNILLGLWLIASPWVFSFSSLQGALWNSIIVGVVVVVLAWVRITNPTRYVWASWVNLLLGLWILVSPWIFSFSTNTGALWDSVITGIVIGALALWSAVAAR